jgi:hypothetical protein
MTIGSLKLHSYNYVGLKIRKPKGCYKLIYIKRGLGKTLRFKEIIA